MNRRNKYLFWLPVFAGMLIFQQGCQEQMLDENGNDGNSVEQEPGKPGLRPGVLHVKFRSSPEVAKALMTRSGSALIGVKSVDDITASLGAVKMERLVPPAGKFEARHKEYGVDRWYKVEFSKDIDVSRIVRSYSSSDVIEYVEPVYENTSFEVTAPFNDPGLSLQWHYDRTGQAVDGSIGLFKAWQVTTGRSDVIVAILDLGVDYAHPDLAANIWVNQAEKNGQEGVDDDKNGYKDDVNGFNFVDGRARIKPGRHGTHVAGTVAAVNNNGIGLCGVAGGNGSGNGVKLMICQVSESEYGFVNEAEAFYYAADNGAVIAQCSWGGNYAIPQSLKEAIDYFIKNAGCDENGVQTGPMKGGIVCVAAGNDGKKNPIVSPAHYDKVIAVAANTSDKTRAAYSNYAEWVDISAPGGDDDPKNPSMWVYSTVLNNGYDYGQGTSMACPHVSGVAALIVSALGGPGFTADMLTRKLYESTVPLNVSPEDASLMGRGLLRADLALWNPDDVPPLAVNDIVVKESADGFVAEWTVTADPNDGQASRFMLYSSQTPLTAGNLSAAHKVEIPIGAHRVGDKMSYALAVETQNVTIYYALVAVDVWGNESGLSNVASFAWANDVQAPAVVNDLRLVKSGGGYALEWTVTSDPRDGQAKSYTLYISKSPMKNGKFDQAETVVIPVGDKRAGEKMSYTLNLPDLNNTAYYFALSARDRWGNQSVLSGAVANETTGAGEFKAYPNPVATTLNLKWGEGFSGMKTMSIYDMSGREVFRQAIGNQPGSGLATFDLSSLAAGKYVLKMASEGLTETRNIVKR